MPILPPLTIQKVTEFEDIQSEVIELSHDLSTVKLSEICSTKSDQNSFPVESVSRESPIGKRPSFHAPDTIELSVGQGAALQTFQVDRKTLCRHSLYFSKALDSDTYSHCITLAGEDPSCFGLFCAWLQKPESSRKYIPNEYSDEPWQSQAAHAWSLGERLDAPRFMHYAFCQFIINCALVDRSTWEFIEDHVNTDTNLRRFSNHWIAWNVSLAQTEFSTLKAASLVDQVSNNTRDPRLYKIEHWDQACGDELGAVCDHNIGIKIRANACAKRKYPHLGRKWELTRRKQFGSSIQSPNLG